MVVLAQEVGYNFNMMKRCWSAIKQEVSSFDTRELGTDKRSVTVLTRGSCCGKGSYKRSVVVLVGDTREL